MNLDELKKQWQAQEESLQETRQVNEQLLRTMLQNRSTDAIGRMMNVEYLSLAVSVLVMMVLLVSSNLYIHELGLGIAFIASTLLLAGAIGWGIYKIRFLDALDFNKTAVAEVAERLEFFRLSMLKEKACSFMLGPVLIAALLLLAQRLVHGSSSAMRLEEYWLKLMLGSIALIVLSIIGYRKYYFNNIKSITQHLKEIRDFRS